MKNTVELPKEFVLEAHKSACDTWKKRIEKVVPELFERKLEVGKWYKGTTFTNEDVLMNCQSESGKLKSYGFYKDNWYDDTKETTYWGYVEESNDWQPATEAEVFEALKKEAVRRGFKEGVSYNCNGLRGRYDRVVCGEVKCRFFSGTTIVSGIGVFCTNNGWIFFDGKWAEIISEPIPKALQKAIDKIGKDKIIEILKK